jgi:hypothetical protein
LNTTDTSRNLDLTKHIHPIFFFWQGHTSSYNSVFLFFWRGPIIILICSAIWHNRMFVGSMRRNKMSHKRLEKHTKSTRGRNTRSSCARLTDVISPSRLVPHIIDKGIEQTLWIIIAPIISLPTTLMLSIFSCNLYSMWQQFV